MDSADKPSPRRRTPWWMYVCAASFLGYFALIVYSHLWGPVPLGAAASYAGGNMLLTEVFPDSPAERAGLRAGDRVLSVNGQAVRSRLDWWFLRTNLEADRTLRVEVERDAKRLNLEFALPQSSWSRWPTSDRIEILTIRGAQFAMLIMAFLIAFSRPYDLTARFGAWFLAAVSVSNPVLLYGWAAAWRALPAPIGALLWIAAVGQLLGGPAFFTFCATFPRKLFRARWAWLLAWVPWAALCLLVSFVLYRVVYHPEDISGLAGLASDRGFGVAVLVALAYAVGGVAALVVNYRRTSDANERRRVRVMVMGFAAGWLPGVPLFLYLYFLPQSGLLKAYFDSPAALLGNALYLAFPLSFAYAILRHRMFDIRVIIRQGLQYALARRALVSLVPALAVILVLDLALHRDQTLGAIFAQRGWIYAVVGGLAALAHTQREHWLGGLDKRFFRERYDAQKLLREVVEDVRKASTLEQVAPRVVAQTEAALHSEFVALAVREPRDPSYRILACSPAGQAPPSFPAESKLMALLRVLGKPIEASLSESGWLKQQLPHEETMFLRQARIDLLIPITVGAERKEALLALGTKRSEEPYSREDQELLMGIATSLALLLERPVAPGRASEAFQECPQCGACYDSGAASCAQEGAALTAVFVPRLVSGRYRLERRLGRGGMGTVYEATDTALDRRVAAKLIRDDLVGSPEAAERFRREARAAAGFAHPNVVTVHDFGLSGSRAFLVMELLEGVSLRQELRHQGRLPAGRTREILRGVCAAVESAHRRQLIHRDLKPENIFLARGESGESAKVLDFGLVKSLSGDFQETADTSAGILVGTLRYMSPDQFRGEAPGPAWDLWALGVVAYELLTGQHPFGTGSGPDLHAAVLGGRFTPIAIAFPEAPPGWQEFFARSLALQAENRPRTAQAFFSELDNALR